jgi:hypothetical protein
MFLCVQAVLYWMKKRDKRGGGDAQGIKGMSREIKVE